MSKLVDKERLAKLAKALDDRAKAAVQTEKERAEAIEQAIDAKAIANAAAIAAINNETTGILKQAKDYADGVGATEQERAEGAEGVLSDRIDAIDAKLKGAVDNFFDGAEDGTKVKEMVANININKAKLADIEEGKTVKAVIDAAVEAEKGRAEDAEAALAGRIAANEALLAAQPAKDQAQDQRIADLEAMMGMGGEEGQKTALEEIREDIEGLENKDTELQGEIDAVEGRMNTAESDIDQLQVDVARLDGAVDVEGSVKKQIKDAIDEVNGAAALLENRVAANEIFVAGYAAKEAKVREDFAAADAQVLADAKKYADEEITKLVDSAPDAMNTLNELAEAIKGNKDVYDAYVEQHAQAMATMKSDLQKEIDDDVKAAVDAQALVNNAQAETNEDFEERIAANEAFVAAQPAIDAAQDKRIKDLEDANKEGGAMAEAVKDAQDAADAAQAAAEAAQGAANAAQADVDAVEKRLDDKGGLVDRLEAAEAFVQGHSHEGLQGEIDAAEGRLDVLEAFEEAHDHSVMEKGIADNKAAIEKEVKDRDAAIEAALETYSTTEEMKQVIGNVVNSLALTMENDKVVLKLGGKDGIALTEVSLDLATDADIDAIVAGLDA